MNMPEKLDFAHLPTPIYRLDRLSEELGRNLFIKRDDYTGMAFSGNKIRKLEFAAREALDQDAGVLITCGGVQSNHCRATAAVAAKLGLKCHLAIKKNEEIKEEGNLLMDRLFGAEITFYDGEPNFDFMEKMKIIGSAYETKGIKPYYIPMGASNGVGNMGYFDALTEIVQQEEQIGTTFDAVCCAIGSGGTYGGLFLSNAFNRYGKTIYSFSVLDTSENSKRTVDSILKETIEAYDMDVSYDLEDMHIFDEYVGRGYALSQPHEIDFIKEIAQKEAVIFDPVYTGKAFLGLVEEIRKGTFDQHENILFIHTGGLFGLFPKWELMG